MKKLVFLAALLLTGYFGFSQEVYVNGYTKSNGTYVQGHYRTAPNNTVNDNWSTKGNVNPYTGEAGYKPRETTYSLPKTYNYNTSTYSIPATKSFNHNTNTYSLPTIKTSMPKSPNYGSSTYKPLRLNYGF